MSLDGITIHALSEELNDKLIEGKINKIYQPEEDELSIDIRNNGSNYKLLISASSNNPRIHLTNDSKKNPQSPPMFCMLLRKHLQGGKIVSITQPSLERIIKFSVLSYDDLGDLSEKELIVEIMGRHSNIILINKNNQKVIDSIKRITPDISRVRQIIPGIIYKMPPKQNKFNSLDINKHIFSDKLKENNDGMKIFKFIYQNFMGISPLVAKEICHRSNIYHNLKIGALENDQIEKLYEEFKNIISNLVNNNLNPCMIYNDTKDKILGFSAIDLRQYNEGIKVPFESVSKLLDSVYITKDRLDRIKQKSLSLKKNIKTKLDRSKNKLSKQKEELINAKDREKYKIYGELITANIYRLEKGLKNFTANNFYDNNAEIKIKLKENLTPSENAQRYFRRYNKLKNAHKLVSKQIEQTKEEIDYLENILLSIENATELSDLEDIKNELMEEGYIKNKKKYQKKKKNKSTSKPKHYISSDNFDIYVGKNNKQNDYLTLKFANKEDIWFHTKNIPGSHVIIVTNGQDVPDTTIMEAANLAAYNSKAKMSSNVPVDFTEQKNVKKPNGSKPGMVIYENNNTIYVTPTYKEISKLKEIN
mgnify:CR=1 FL=1